MATASIKNHPSYRQVMMDVDRCAGRLEQIRQVYLHKTEDETKPQLDSRRTSKSSEAEAEHGESEESCRKKHDESDDNGDCNVDSDGNENSAQEEVDEEDDDNDEELKKQKIVKETLAGLIVKLLIKNPDLHYYQGFHDVCLTYMILVGEKDAFRVLNQLIKTHFISFMRPTMHETEEFLALVPVLIGLHDSKLQEFLERAEIGTIFSLSWIITWFSHVITDETDVEKIFKFLEKQDPHMVLYLCAEVVMFKRDKIMELEPEMSTVHHYLCRIPRKEKLPIESLILKASKAFSKWPPEVLKQNLDRHRRAKLQVHTTNILRTLASRFAPSLTNMGSPNAKTAILVLAFASAFAIYGIDKWMK